MNFGKDSIKYIGRNLPRLLLFAVVPAIAFAFTGSPSTFITFFINFNLRSTTVWSIYQNFTLIGSRNWFLGILTILLLIFFTSLLYAAIDRHMKVGKFSFSRPFSRINETIMAVLPYVIVVIFVMEVAAFINSALIYLFVKVAASGAFFIAIVITLIVYICLLICLSQFILLIPSEIVAGYPVKDACVYSTRVIAGKGKIVFFDLAGNFLFCALISSVFAIFLPKLEFLQIIVDSILYCYMIIYLVSYTMVAYFDLSSEPRRDLEYSKKNYLT